MKKYKIIGIGLLILATVVLSGCSDAVRSNFAIGHNGATLVITEFEGDLRLHIDGKDNHITVASNVSLRAISVASDGNVIEISRIHNATINLGGTNSRILFYD